MNNYIVKKLITAKNIGFFELNPKILDQFVKRNECEERLTLEGFRPHNAKKVGLIIENPFSAPRPLYYDLFSLVTFV